MKHDAKELVVIKILEIHFDHQVAFSLRGLQRIVVLRSVFDAITTDLVNIERRRSISGSKKQEGKKNESFYFGGKTHYFYFIFAKQN